MRDPFDDQRKGRGWSRLLDFDCLDRFIHVSDVFMASSGETWESLLHIFFRRFRVTGFKKALVEIFDELTDTLDLVGFGIVSGAGAASV